MEIPIVMPPRNCERAVLALMIRPHAKTPSSRSTRTCPLSRFTLTSANCAPNEWRAKRFRTARSSAVSARAPRPSGGTRPDRSSRSLTSARQALLTAQLQEEVPMDPPASAAGPKTLRPTLTVTRSIGTPSSSAATWVSAVRAPVPMSAAAISTTNLPVGSA